MKKCTSLLIGRGTIAVRCLDVLQKKEMLPQAIICDSFDEGNDTWTDSLYKRAKELGYKDNINLFKERKVNTPEFVALIQKLFPSLDIIFSIQPYAIFRMPFIHLAKRHVVNLHFAPLPKLRGVSPCSWAFLDGLSEMGVTLHLIEDEGIDNGPILFQTTFPIDEKDTAWTLFHTCITYGVELFRQHVDAIMDGHIDPIPQDETNMTYHSKHELDFSLCELDVHHSKETILRFIKSRIFPPFQLPYIQEKEKKFFIKGFREQKGDKAPKREPVVTRQEDAWHLDFGDSLLILDTKDYN